jgi:benzoate/toluate 1,2-dioxygenase beta subunit/2,4,5-trichlorophenoxyacetic acid oxygenase 2
MNERELQFEVSQLLAREAWLLDSRAWNEWVSLYCEDAVFWVPTWLDEDRVSDDPMTQLSFIYLEGRKQFEERIAKATDPRAPASLPLSRTTHQLGPVMMVTGDAQAQRPVARCAWHSSIYDPKSRRQAFYSGSYEHELERDAQGALKIRKKTITIINDEIDSRLDFFYI